MKKNIISFLFVAIYSLALAGCGGRWDDVKTSSASPIKSGSNLTVYAKCVADDPSYGCRNVKFRPLDSTIYESAELSCVDHQGFYPVSLSLRNITHSGSILLECGYQDSVAAHSEILKIDMVVESNVTITPSSTVESMIQLEPEQQQKLTLTLPANTRLPVGSKFTILESQGYISFVGKNSCTVSTNQSSCSVTVQANSNISTPVRQTLKVVTSGYPTESVFIEIGNHGYSGKVIYVTNGSYSGVFGNSATDALTNADNYCNTDTAKPFSSGNFKAILKSSLRNAYNNGPWVLESNTVYYNTNNESIGMTNGSKYFSFPLSHAIESTANNVWSGMDGSWSLMYNCNDWYQSSSGSFGVSDVISSSSIYSSSQLCSQTAHLYCAQQ